MRASGGASVVGHGWDRARATSAHEFAMLEEFSFIRREAQAEANLAYEDWARVGSAAAYAVYRAAQDRADAAQDDLAQLAQRIARRSIGALTAGGVPALPVER